MLGALGGSAGCQRGSVRRDAIKQVKARQVQRQTPAKLADGAAPAETIEVADCKSLISRICTDLGADHVGCTLSREKLPVVGDAECKKLGPRYGALIADLRLRSDVQKDATPEVMRRMMTLGNPASFGPVDAPIQVVEFLDFECSGCANLAGQVDSLRSKVKENGSWAGKVRYVARMKPLTKMHKQAMLAAQAAVAAHLQGKYWVYQDLLFANQGDLGRKKLIDLAKFAKLDMPRFTKDLDSQKVKDVVAQDLALAKEVAAPATPSVFMNKMRINPGTFEVTLVDALNQYEALSR